MNDDDTDSAKDFFIDMVKVVIALFLFILFVTLLGGIVWSLI